MTAVLFLAPSSDTALHHLRRQVEGWRRDQQLTAIHLLLPSRAVTDRVRGTVGDTMNVHYHQIYDLGRSVLKSARLPSYELNDTAIRRLVKHLLQRMARDGEICSFAPVVEKPGFTDAMVTWLREMKSQGIHPDEVSAHARTSGGERDLQLARLYQRYQRFLQGTDTSDADGLLWLAAEALESDADLFRHRGPLFVLGFDQFTPIQLRILKELTDRYDETAIFLTWDPERDENSLALTRLAHTRRQLHEALEATETVLAPSLEEGAHPALLHLRRSLFEAVDDENVMDAGYAVRLVEAPSREEEMRWAMRAIKKLLLDGVDYSGIALTAPKPGIYRRLAETVAAEYGVPIQVEQTLATNPAVTALLTVLSLYPDFPWRQTFQALRSPYVRQSWLTWDQLDLLDQLTRERPVVAGVDQWRFALRPLTLQAGEPEDDEDRTDRPLVSKIPKDELARLEAGLLGFFEHLTPPSSGDYRDWVLWVQEAILGLFTDALDPDEPQTEAVTPSLSLLDCCAEGPYPARDLRAVPMVLSVLSQLVIATDLVPEDEAGPTWTTFVNDLAVILPAVPVRPDPRIQAVAFSALEANRSLPVDYVFVLGLGEGELPSPRAPDPLYAPQERAEHPLPLRRILPSEDACLWWQVVGNCRRRLTLLRPWADENGAEWPPSPYWSEVQTRFLNLSARHISTAAAVPIDEAASHNELLTALASAGAKDAPPSLAAAWKQAHSADELMAQRRSWRDPGIYEGILQAVDLREDLATRFGPEHVWSASRLNRYGNCPYGFFAEQILKLEARTDPEEGLDAVQRGSILHAILERLYGALAERGIGTGADHVEEVLALLDDACERTFQDAPRRYGFRPSPLWRHEQAEMRQLLAALVQQECEENGAVPPYLPYRQEVAFGIRGVPPVFVEDEDGTGLYLRGFIDRVDRSPDHRLRVVDYKSGSTPYSKNDVQSGLALQTALYALAAEKLLDCEVSQSFYLHIPSRKPSGKLEFTGPVADSNDIQAAVAAAGGSVARIRSGVFPSAPAKPQSGTMVCSSWCQLSPVCRVTRHSLAKGRPLLERE